MFFQYFRLWIVLLMIATIAMNGSQFIQGYENRGRPRVKGRIEPLKSDEDLKEIVISYDYPILSEVKQAKIKNDVYHKYIQTVYHSGDSNNAIPSTGFPKSSTSRIPSKNISPTSRSVDKSGRDHLIATSTDSDRGLSIADTYFTTTAMSEHSSTELGRENENIKIDLTKETSASWDVRASSVSTYSGPHGGTTTKSPERYYSPYDHFKNLDQKETTSDTNPDKRTLNLRNSASTTSNEGIFSTSSSSTKNGLEDETSSDGHATRISTINDLSTSDAANYHEMNETEGTLSPPIIVVHRNGEDSMSTTENGTLYDNVTDSDTQDINPSINFNDSILHLSNIKDADVTESSFGPLELTVEQRVQDTTLEEDGTSLSRDDVATGIYEDTSSTTTNYHSNESNEDALFSIPPNTTTDETKLPNEFNSSTSVSDEIVLSSDNASLVSTESKEVTVTIIEQVSTALPTGSSSHDEDTISDASTEDSSPPSMTDSSTATSNLSLSTETGTKLSPQRVEYGEDDRGDINWRCPPDDEVTNSSRNGLFVWYKLSNGVKSVTPLHGRIDARTNFLTIENPTSADEGRYICMTRDDSPFVASQMYFYQFLILKTQWVDIGSVSTVAIYFNQKLVLNCAHGDIVTNNNILSQCPSRVTVVERQDNSSQGVYSCSNNINETTQIFSTQSHTNCSLSLLGCPSTTENTGITDYKRCLLQSYTSRIQSSSCNGETFIRFYFDDKKQSCLPYETDICGADNSTFSTLSECEHVCYLISTDIQPCFHAMNPGEDQMCDESRDGVYRVSYNIVSNECVWFYHREGCPISKNVFSSEIKCLRACSHSRPLIEREMKKTCHYRATRAFSAQSGVLRWVFLPPINDCVQRNVSLTAKPFTMSFTTKKGCQACRTESAEEICRSRPINGKCKKREIKWHFNYLLGHCVRILDGGCGPSLNRFSSKSICADTCSSFLIPISTSTRVNSTLSRHSSTAVRPTISTLSSVQENVFTTISRRRFHRAVSLIQTNSVPIKINDIKSVADVRDMLDESERTLDSDPCLGKAILGTCNSRRNVTITRYTYKAELKVCHRVKFSGCAAGENLFDDANDCQEACTHRLRDTLKNARCRTKDLDMCKRLDAAANPAIVRYHYSASRNLCLPHGSVYTDFCLSHFFESHEECNEYCLVKPPTEEHLRNKCYGPVVVDTESCATDQRLQRWFFMASIRQCLQYLTCDVSPYFNAFPTRTSCEEECLTADVTTVCNLPSDVGLGRHMFLKYFYDWRRGRCRVLMYRGSMGNWNRFGSMEECEEVCVESTSTSSNYSAAALTRQTLAGGTSAVVDATWSRIEDFNSATDREYCLDMLTHNVCRDMPAASRITRYYYSTYTKRCQPFAFRGCGPTSRNHFESMALCEKMCTARIKQTVFGVCTRESGRCHNSSFKYWTYNDRTGVCQLSSFCSEQVPTEVFTDEESCVRRCGPPLPLMRDLFDICHLPRTVSLMCPSLSQRWHYDHVSRSCVSTSGCAVYGNNFESMESCMQTCTPRNHLDVCMLPEDRGPCTGNSTSHYFFDWSMQSCRTFLYGGCLGNKNRFSSQSDCDTMCPAHNRCHFNIRKTSCYLDSGNNQPLFMFNFSENRCERIADTVCGNYYDFYQSKNDCEKGCVITDDLRRIAYNYQKNTSRIMHPRCAGELKCNHYSSGLNTTNWLPRFYYDQREGQCRFFYYNVCAGPEDSGNRFSSMYLCQNICYPNHTVSTTTRSSNNASSTSRPNEPRVEKGVCPEPHNECQSLYSEPKICHRDVDCNLHSICCSCKVGESRESHCMEPVICTLSRYGCCANSDVEAADLLHMNCSKTTATCLNMSESVIIAHSKDEAYLECLLSGDPRPNITWTHLETRRVVEVETMWDIVLPAWSGVLQFNKSDSSAMGVWVCRGANEAGQDDIEVKVGADLASSALSAIKLYDEGKRNSTLKYVALRSNVLLHCPIYGVPRPSIQWFFNKSAVHTDGEHITVRHRFVNIDDVPSSVEGLWTCIGQQGASFVSFLTVLQVLEPVQILPPPHGHLIKAVIGQKVILYCNVVGAPRHNITWSLTREGVTTVVESVTKDSRKCVIKSLTHDSQGDYVCTARNNISEESMLLTVGSAAVDDILVNPAGFHFMGDQVTLHCPVKYKERIFQVTWKKDNVEMAVRGRKLNFMLHSKLDSGFYTCHHSGRSYHTHIYVHN